MVSQTRHKDRECVVIGIDPGSRVTGYGIICELSGCLSLLACGTIRTSTTQDSARRLGKIYQDIAALLTEFSPHEAAVEQVFVAKNASSALKLGQARGAALAALANHTVPVSSYEPAKVKQSLVGTGRATKDQVAFMVAQILAQKNPGWAQDASDALAVAVCHLNQRRLNTLTRLAKQ